MSDALFDTPDRNVGLIVNAPNVFARPDFMAWLNDPERKVFTWHDRTLPEAHEYSDVIVLVDAAYDGDSSDMPEDIWIPLCDLVYAEYGGVDLVRSLGATVAVRLTNLT